MSDVIEYCAVHDRPLRLCESPDGCRAVMRAWGLYGQPSEAERRAADELTRLSEELGLYGNQAPGSLDS